MFPDKKDLESLLFSDIYTENANLFESALSDSDSDIRYEALKCCFKLFDEKNFIPKVDHSFFKLVMYLIRDNTLGSKVVDFLYELSRIDFSFFANQETIEFLSNVQKHDCETEFRVIDLVLKIYCHNPSWSLSSRILDEIMSYLMSDDILYQMNILELFSKMMSMPNGANILTDLQLVPIILGYIKDPNGFLTCPALKCISEAMVQIDELDNFLDISSFLVLVDNCLANGDVLVKECSLTVIGAISSRPGVFKLVNNSKFSQGSLTSQLVHACEYGAGTIKIAAMLSICHILEARGNPTSMSECSRILYNMFDRPAMKIFIGFAGSVYEEVKGPSFQLILALSKYEWGLREIAISAVEFLTNRSLDGSHLAQTWKYSIIESAINSPFASDVFDEPRFDKLKDFVKKGVFFAPIQQIVATETQ